MSLTLGHGPLASKPGGHANYHVDGPGHRLWMHDFDRRVRALFGGETVLDSRAGKLLHESNLLPQLYVPRADLREDLLEPTTHTTHCPFKGDATYYSVHAGGRVAENAVWAYPEAGAGAEWLREHLAVYWSAMDAWFDEDEEVNGHLRDPYHRVDVRRTSRHVRILADGTGGAGAGPVGGPESDGSRALSQEGLSALGEAVVADTRRAKVLSETGLPVRYYVPPEDVRVDLLEPSALHTHCPYKGRASYRGVRANGRTIADAAWFYPEPLEEATRVRDHLCFLADGLHTEVDGEVVE